MHSLSVDVLDEENIARAVFHPYHLNNKGTKLRSSVYKAPAERFDVSVNRLIALNATECKRKALKISSGDFRGFAVIKVEIIRKNKSGVIDTRDGNYYGHADIIHPIKIKKGEPAPPELNQYLKNMTDNSNFYIDPNPESKKWDGAALD